VRALCARKVRMFDAGTCRDRNETCRLQTNQKERLRSCVYLSTYLFSNAHRLT
jgi:hypothetical protein